MTDSNGNADNEMASKAESLQIFQKLKTKPENKVGQISLAKKPIVHGDTDHEPSRSASTANRTTLRGPRCRSQSTSASTAPRTTEIWVYTSPLFDLRTLIVCVDMGIWNVWVLTRA